MTDLEQAVELLGVDAKFLQPFDTTDPFTDEVRLEGFLCQRPDHRYGALALLRVDGRHATQRIFATPNCIIPLAKTGGFSSHPSNRRTFTRSSTARMCWPTAIGTRMTAGG